MERGGEDRKGGERKERREACQAGMEKSGDQRLFLVAADFAITFVSVLLLIYLVGRVY